MLNGCINEVFSNRATSLIRPPTVGPEGGRINEVSLYILAKKDLKNAFSFGANFNTAILYLIQHS